MSLIDDDLQDLLITYCEPESELLQQIDRETNLKVLMPRMLSGHYQGRVLSMLSKMVSPNRILEIGTFTGYATLCLAEGLTNNGIIYTLDINVELEEMVRNNFEKSPYNNKIKYILGDATQTVNKLDEIFDIVFIDADKENYGRYYDLVIKHVPLGGYILADNVLWSGKVLSDKPDKDTRAIQEFNRNVHMDSRIENVLLPIRDGIMMMRKVKD